MSEVLAERSALIAWSAIAEGADPAAEWLIEELGAAGSLEWVRQCAADPVIATVALAARYNDLVAVVAGTTLAMLIADVPAVFVGDKIAKRVPMKLVHSIAAGIFAVLGVLTLFNVGKLF